MADPRRKRIFVVDDEQLIATTLATILERSGFSAQCFFNPLEALDAARCNAPDLLISDVMMPELSGVELAVQIKALWPLCQILLFSGQAGTADLLQTAREQGHDFHLLSKPVHPSDLLKEIRRQEPVCV
ncbi:response regulator [Granulicella arctica]|uniref:response regulator n=1 Tax=Granulicella arctica TaxID=940613 RepID=UPI0021E0A7CC|nr:response regulator [Granulicella arctica]